MVNLHNLGVQLINITSEMCDLPMGFMGLEIYLLQQIGAQLID